MSPKACWRSPTEPRMTIKGTLAADALDLTPYVSTIEILRYQRARLEPRADRGRRARRLRSRPAALGGARDGCDAPSSDAPASPPICARAASPSRSAKRRPMAACSRVRWCSRNPDAGADIKSQMQFADVDLESCLGELVRHPQARRQGNLSLAVEASGDSVFALTRTLAGNAEPDGAPGRHRGIQCRAIAQAAGAASALDRRAISAAGERRSRSSMSR